MKKVLFCMACLAFLANCSNANVVALWEFGDQSNGYSLLPGERIHDSSGNGRDIYASGSGADMPVYSNSILNDIDLDTDLVFQPGYNFEDGGPVAGTAIPDLYSFTIEMVVKFDGDKTTQRNRGLISKGYNATGSQFWWRIEAGDWSRFYMVDENGTAKTLAGNLGNGITTNVYDGQWHHFAIVRDTENDRIKFYLDKILVMDQLDPLTGGISNNALLYLGNFAGGTDLLGSFDTIRISDEALTATQFIPEPATILLLLGGGTIVRRFKY